MSNLSKGNVSVRILLIIIIFSALCRSQKFEVSLIKALPESAGVQVGPDGNLYVVTVCKAVSTSHFSIDERYIYIDHPLFHNIFIIIIITRDIERVCLTALNWTIKVFQIQIL